MVLAGGGGLLLLTGREPADKSVPDLTARAAASFPDDRSSPGGMPEPASSGQEASCPATRPAGLRSRQGKPPAESRAGGASIGQTLAQRAARAVSSGNSMLPYRQPGTHLSGPAPYIRQVAGPAAESEPTAFLPQFRPVQTESRSGDSADRAAAVVLDFADNQQLPAVLAAPETEVNGHRSSLQRIQENRIAGEFISAVTASAPAPTGHDGTVSAHTPDTSSPMAGSGSNSGWDAAVHQADEAFRALVGQDVYQQKALEAAILKRQAAEAPH